MSNKRTTTCNSEDGTRLTYQLHETWTSARVCVCVWYGYVVQGKGLGGGVATGKVEHILVTDTGSCRCTACLTPAATAERGRERMSQREEEGRYTLDKTRQGRQAEGCHKYLCEFWEQQCRRRLMLLQLHMRLSKTVPHTHCLTRPPPPTPSSHTHTHSLTPLLPCSWQWAAGYICTCRTRDMFAQRLGLPPVLACPFAATPHAHHHSLWAARESSS